MMMMMISRKNSNKHNLDKLWHRNFFFFEKKKDSRLIFIILLNGMEFFSSIHSTKKKNLRLHRNFLERESFQNQKMRERKKAIILEMNGKEKKIPFYQFSHLIDAFGCHTTANTHNQFVGANFFFRGPFLNNNNNNTTTHQHYDYGQEEISGETKNGPIFFDYCCTVKKYIFQMKESIYMFFFQQQQQQRFDHLITVQEPQQQLFCFFQSNYYFFFYFFWIAIIFFSNLINYF